MKSFRLVFVLLSLLLMNACTKEHITYVDDSFKLWTYFKNGTYWIYINEKTNTYDTNYIIGDASITYNPDTPPQYEYIHLNLTSNFIKSYVIYVEHHESMLKIGLNGPLWANGDVLSSSVIAGTSDSISRECRLINVHDTMMINGTLFANVIQTRDSTVDNGNTVVADFYFVKNFGLVRFDATIENPDFLTIDTYAWSLLKIGVRTQK